jgi:hypothetical protein
MWYHVLILTKTGVSLNKITHKLINAGITSLQQLEEKINANNLNDHLDDHGMARLHPVTIIGFVRQGQS